MAAHIVVPGSRRPSLRLKLCAPFLVGVAAVAAVPHPGYGQAEPAGQAESSGPAQYGRLTANTTVFSGAGANFYQTMRLPKDAEVVVVGVKGTWLKILPPEGSFSYVPKHQINRYGDGRRGKVSEKTLVKAGSTLVPAKSTVQTKLDVGADVTIIDEENEYFKIKPPEGAYLFVSKDAVQPLGTVPPTGTTPPPARTTTPDGATPPPDDARVRPPATGPVTPPGPLAVAPTSRPASAEALAQLQKLESDFTQMSTKPLPDQPVAEMLAEYEKLAATPGLPDVAKRVADVRIATLKVRADARDSFADSQKKQQDLQQRMQAQQAEKDEIQQRIKDIGVQVYAAVGVLRPSSLQVNKTTLYRLTDPQTGRTVVYVWGTDPKVGELLGQFVGVKGPMQSDPRLNLKVVTPAATDVVDPAKVNKNVVAEITPPSLLPKAPAGGTASTGN